MVASNPRPTPPGRENRGFGRCTLPLRGGCAFASNPSNPQGGVSDSRRFPFLLSVYNLIPPLLGWTGWTQHIDPEKTTSIDLLPAKLPVQGGLDIAGGGVDAAANGQGGVNHE